MFAPRPSNLEQWRKKCSFISPTAVMFVRIVTPSRPSQAPFSSSAPIYCFVRLIVSCVHCGVANNGFNVPVAISTRRILRFGARRIAKCKVAHPRWVTGFGRRKIYQYLSWTCSWYLIRPIAAKGCVSVGKYPGGFRQPFYTCVYSGHAVNPNLFVFAPPRRCRRERAVATGERG